MLCGNEGLFEAASFFYYTLKLTMKVGPIYKNKEKDEEHLRTAVWNALQLASKRKLKSIALPAISSGIFGFPKVRT